MNLKVLAVILLLALVGLSVLSRFAGSRQAAEPVAANKNAEERDEHVKIKDGEPIDFPVTQELRKEFTLQPNVMVYVSGINGKLDVETSATDKAEVYLVRSVRRAEDFEERNVNIRQDNDGDLGIEIRNNRERSIWAFLGTRNDERQRLQLRLPRNVRFKIARTNANTTIGELDNSLVIHGLNGDLKAERVTTAAELEGINGDLDVTFANLTKGIWTRGINGNLNLRFADAINADISLHGHNGHVKNELPNFHSTEKEQHHGNYEARIGNGGVTIEGHGINGNFNLLMAAKAPNLASK
jgi:hypothetical protein